MIFRKPFVFFTPHRQTYPIIFDESNRKKYIFININMIWKHIPFKATNKWKFKIMYCVFWLMKPKMIISINWISIYESFYRVWTKKNPECSSIVIQHGSYIGGIVTDIAHKYTKCDEFLTWGPHFTYMFKNLNAKKKTFIRTFGNPVFNQHDRSLFQYPDKKTKKILLAPSGIKGERLNALHELYKLLESLGFEVEMKAHNFQFKRFEAIDDIPLTSESTYDLLTMKRYDAIVVDHSSIMLDAIFFKNPIVFFSPPGELVEFTENVYSQYLKNRFNETQSLKCEQSLYEWVDLKAQENLFENLVYIGTNKISC